MQGGDNYGVVITFLLCGAICLLSIPFIAVGSGFIILYMKKRQIGNNPKKIKLVLPVVSVCIGDILLTPLAAFLGIPVAMPLIEVIKIKVFLIASLIILIFSIILCLVCAVRAYRGNPVTNKFLSLSLIILFIGLFVFAVPCLYYFVLMQ